MASVLVVLLHLCDDAFDAKEIVADSDAEDLEEEEEASVLVGAGVVDGL